MKIHIPACIAMAMALMSTTVSGQIGQNQRIAAPQQNWQVPVVQASNRQEPALAVQSNATPAPAMNNAYSNVVDCGCEQQCNPCEPERYVTIFGGGATFNDIGFNLTATDPAGSTTDLSAILEQNNGWTIGGGIGRRFRKRLRGELEWSYRNASLNSGRIDLNGQTQGGDIALDGQINIYRSMSNLYIDLNPCGRFNPYFGGGLGLGFVDLDAQEPATPLSARLQASSFMYQGIIGVSTRLSQRVDMYLDYRYSGSDKLELDAASPIGNLNTSVDITSNDVFLGFRFKR